MNKEDQEKYERLIKRRDLAARSAIDCSEDLYDLDIQLTERLGEITLQRKIIGKKGPKWSYEEREQNVRDLRELEGNIPEIIGEIVKSFEYQEKLRDRIIKLNTQIVNTNALEEDIEFIMDGQGYRTLFNDLYKERI